MSATQTMLERARADGLEITVNDGRVKLRGSPDAIARWTPELSPYKAQIIEAANEPHDLDGAQSERAAILEFAAGISLDVAELLARHGDASAGGVDWTLHRLVTDVQSSRRWLVVTSLGCTTLTITAPTTRAEVMKSLRYSAALPIGDAP